MPMLPTSTSPATTPCTHAAAADCDEISTGADPSPATRVAPVDALPTVMTAEPDRRAVTSMMPVDATLTGAVPAPRTAAVPAPELATLMTVCAAP